MSGWILERWDGVMWTGLVWIGTGGELLWIRYWISGFRKCWETIEWPRTAVRKCKDLLHHHRWSSGQSSWLQIQMSGFGSRRCQIFWEVVVLERGQIIFASSLTCFLGSWWPPPRQSFCMHPCWRIPPHTASTWLTEFCSAQSLRQSSPYHPQLRWWPGWCLPSFQFQCLPGNLIQPIILWPIGGRRGGAFPLGPTDKCIWMKCWNSPTRARWAKAVAKTWQWVRSWLSVGNDMLQTAGDYHGRSQSLNAVGTLCKALLAYPCRKVSRGVGVWLSPRLFCWCAPSQPWTGNKT
jgi:hypothetical protein